MNDEIVSVSSTVPVRGVADLHLLAAALVVPVEEVQLQVVRLAVGEVDVDGEAGGGVPDGGDAVGRAGDLQGAGVGGGGRPGVGRLAAGRDGVVGREAGRAADDVVALRAVGADPAPLRRRVLLEERRGRRDGGGVVLHGADVGAARPGPRAVAALVGGEVLGIGPFPKAGLPACRAMVCVGPPLLARPAVASLGSTPMRLPEPVIVSVLGAAWIRESVASRAPE